MVDDTELKLLRQKLSTRDVVLTPMSQHTEGASTGEAGGHAGSGHRGEPEASFSDYLTSDGEGAMFSAEEED
jgi:hypothetical protein